MNIKYISDNSFLSTNNKSDFTRAYESLSASQLTQLLIQNPSLIYKVDEKTGNSLLLRSVEVNNIEKAVILLKAGSDFNIQNSLGETCLYISVDNSNLILTEILLQSGANPNIQQQDGETPLHLAAFKNEVKLIKILIEAGANPYIKTFSNYLALDYAYQKNSQDAVEAILTYMNSINKVNKHSISQISLYNQCSIRSTPNLDHSVKRGSYQGTYQNHTEIQSPSQIINRKSTSNLNSHYQMQGFEYKRSIELNNDNTYNTSNLDCFVRKNTYKNSNKTNQTNQTNQSSQLNNNKNNLNINNLLKNSNFHSNFENFNGEIEKMKNSLMVEEKEKENNKNNENEISIKPNDYEEDDSQKGYSIDFDNANKEFTLKAKKNANTTGNTKINTHSRTTIDNTKEKDTLVYHHSNSSQLNLNTYQNMNSQSNFGNFYGNSYNQAYEPRENNDNNENNPFVSSSISFKIKQQPDLKYVSSPYTEHRKIGHTSEISSEHGFQGNNLSFYPTFARKEKVKEEFIDENKALAYFTSEKNDIDLCETNDNLGADVDVEEEMINEDNQVLYEIENEEEREETYRRSEKDLMNKKIKERTRNMKTNDNRNKSDVYNNMKLGILSMSQSNSKYMLNNKGHHSLAYNNENREMKCNYNNENDNDIDNDSYVTYNKSPEIEMDKDKYKDKENRTSNKKISKCQDKDDSKSNSYINKRKDSNSNKVNTNIDTNTNTNKINVFTYTNANANANNQIITKFNNTNSSKETRNVKDNKEIYSFLKELNLEEYSSNLINNGYDDLSFLVNKSKTNVSTISDSELDQIGMTLPGDKARFLIKLQEKNGFFNFEIPPSAYYSQKRNKQKGKNNELVEDNVKDEYISNLELWLRQLKLEKLLGNFLKNGYFSVETMLIQMASSYPLTDKILFNDLVIEKIGYRTRILNKLRMGKFSINYIILYIICFI